MKSRRTDSPAPRPKTASKWTVFTVVAVGVFMSTLDGSIVNIALPAIMKDLAAPLPIVEWVMMIYLLTVSSLLLTFGKLGDMRGRQWIYIRGLLLFTFGSLLCAISGSARWLIISRAVQGIGAAMIMSCTQAIIASVFPVKERGRALGSLGAVVASGLTLGPAIGGSIIHTFSWQAIFFINIPVGALTLWMAGRLLKEQKPAAEVSPGFDWQGSVLLGIGTGALLVAITHGYDWGYRSPLFIGLGGASIVMFGLLIRQERRSPRALLPPFLFRIPLFAFPVLSTMILFMSLFIIVFLMPFYLIYPCGYSIRTAGMVMVTPFVYLFALSPLCGALSDRIGSRLLCTLGMAILAIAFLLISRMKPIHSLWPVIWRLSLVGLGVSIFTAPNNATAMTAVPAANMGVAAGMVATVRNLGMVFGIAMAGGIFNTVFFRESGGLDLQGYHPSLRFAFMTAFQHAMAAGGIVAALGIIAAFLRGPDRKRA